MPPFWLWPYACWPSATGPGSTRSEFSLYLEPSYVCHKPMCSGSLHGIISRWQIFSNCSTCCCHQHSTLSVVTTDEWLHADANSATVLSQPFQSQKAAYCKHMLIHFMLLCLPHKLKHLVCGLVQVSHQLGRPLNRKFHAPRKIEFVEQGWGLNIAPPPEPRPPRV